MINLFIDPFLLFCPTEADGEESLRRYLRGLLEWRDVSYRECIAMYTTQTASEVLAAAGGFPPWHGVRVLIERLNMIDELGPHDVFNVFQRFTDRLPTIEDRLGIDEVLIEGVQCHPHPRQALGGVFATAFERMLALMCVFEELNSSESEHMLLTRELAHCPEKLSFQATLSDADGPSAGGIDLPKELTGTFNAFSCAKQFRLGIDATRLLEEAKSDETFLFAIECYTCARAAASAIASLPAWSLGSTFRSTVKALNAHRGIIAKSVLRACGETILSQNMSAVHAIRVDQDANSAQRKRGSDSAWRRDIDQEYHLHYWSTAEGPELASVVVHKDISIPD